MKVNWRRLFSFSVSDTEYDSNHKDKFEFIGCSKKEYSCLSFLPAVNKYFRESDTFYREKDYYRAVEALEKAYYKATEIREPDCQRCSVFFQATAVQSLEGIQTELQRMTKGIFATRRHQPVLEKVDRLINRIRGKEEKSETSIPATKERPSLQPVYNLVG